MATILRGKPVSDAILQKCGRVVSKRINESGLAPALACVSIGNNPSNNSYLKSISKKAQDTGVIIKNYTLDDDVNTDFVIDKIKVLNNKKTIHGILLLKPFNAKSYLDVETISQSIDPKKDVDCSTWLNSSSAYLNVNGYSPCTAEACIEILNFYNIDLQGKDVCIIGRSHIVGRPLSQLALNKNATVTVCHTKTKDISKHTKKADIVFVATGTPNKFDSKYFTKGQVVVDAGINWDSKQNKLVGDVDFNSVENVVDAITPVPGGVGIVTTSVLLKHVVGC